MPRYEYKVIPAPAKGRKARGVKGAAPRFAHTLQSVMNKLGAEGWAYQRTDILPSEERQGLASSHTVYRSMLVFCRELPEVEAPVVKEVPLAIAALSQLELAHLEDGDLDLAEADQADEDADTVMGSDEVDAEPVAATGEPEDAPETTGVINGAKAVIASKEDDATQEDAKKASNGAATAESDAPKARPVGEMPKGYADYLAALDDSEYEVEWPMEDEAEERSLSA